MSSLGPYDVNFFAAWIMEAQKAITHLYEDRIPMAVVMETSGSTSFFMNKLNSHAKKD